MVLGEDGEKMSKSRGNVVAPDELVSLYGADVVRAYLMFYARWDLGGPWDSQGVGGPNRWLRRVWNLVFEVPDKKRLALNIEQQLRRKVHNTLKNVTKDFENFEFNTIISSLMELLNSMYDARDKAIEIYLRMLAPVTPHLAEELWVEHLGKPYSIHNQPWPEVDELAIIEEEFTLIVQVNGKVRDRMQVPVGITKEDASNEALKSKNVVKFFEGKQPKKVIYISGRLINFVI